MTPVPRAPITRRHTGHDGPPAAIRPSRHTTEHHRTQTPPAPPARTAPLPQLTGVHRLLIGVAATGAVIIAGIGFTGSYTAVRNLAQDKGFGHFAHVFPIGIDAGICVLLALDLLLTWLRIPLPLLRHTAWLLTAATIAFNAASAWPDLIATGMHAVIPVLFVACVEAARHAIGRIMDITADQHMEGVRPIRWLLSPAPTFLLWRRMQLWEIRSYSQAVTREQERLTYQAHLRTRYGRTWRRKAPIESLLPLRLARYGIPLTHTTPTTPATTDIAEPPPPTQLTPAPHQADDPSHRAHDGSGTQLAPLSRPARRDLGDGNVRQRPLRADDFGTAAETPHECTPHPAPAPAANGAAASNGATTHPHTGTGHPLPDPSPLQLPSTYPEFIARAHTAPTPITASSAVSAYHPRPAPDGRNQNGPPLREQSRTSAAEPVPDTSAHQTDTTTPRSAPTPARTPTPPADQAGQAPASGVHPPTNSAGKGDTVAGSTRRPPQPSPPTAPEAPPRALQTDSSSGPKPSTPLPPTPADRRRTAAPGDQHDPQSDSRSTGLTRQPTGNEQLPLTDRYYLAWTDYQSEHGGEPTAEQLSTHLAGQGLLGRGGKPISPANLRRHLLHWRIYKIWSAHRADNAAPSSADIAQQCATLGITGQYNRPITLTYITQAAPEFERRWHTLTHHAPTNHRRP